VLKIMSMCKSYMKKRMVRMFMITGIGRMRIIFRKIYW
jgi:hypothetical protein